MNEDTRKALELAKAALNDCDPMTIWQSEHRAIAAIDAALSAPAAPVAQAGLKVGNLQAVNQDEYPNLGAWWIQIWDGDRVVGCAYGDTPHAAHEMAVKLSCNAAPAAPVATYVNERGEEVPERRIRRRDADDPRITHLFDGFDSRIESAQVNFDKYAEGYLRAMRAEFAGLMVDMLAAPVAQKPVAWLRNITDPQPHAVTDLKYRSAADAGAGVEYIPVYAAPAAPLAQPLKCAERKPGVVYVAGYGYVDEKAVRAIERTHGITKEARNG